MMMHVQIHLFSCTISFSTADHSKFVGSFHDSQDFIDVVETILRGALQGKSIVANPIDPAHVPKYELLYKDY